MKKKELDENNISVIKISKEDNKGFDKIKLVIFDMDGTILDTLQDLTDSVNHSLSVNGYQTRTLKEIRSFLGNGRRKLVERAVPDNITTEEIDKVFNELVKYYPKNCTNKTKPYEGIIELFEKLKENGIHIAVNSNKDDSEVRILVNKYYDNLVEYSVGAMENVPKKPANDGVNTIMEYFNVSREETIYVGDSDVDIKTAVNSNIDAFIVDWGFRDHDCLQDCINKVYEDMNYSGNMEIVSGCEELLNKLSCYYPNLS